MHAEPSRSVQSMEGYDVSYNKLEKKPTLGEKLEKLQREIHVRKIKKI